MVRRINGGLIGPSNVARSAGANGVWSTNEQEYWTDLNQWPSARQDSFFRSTFLLMNGDGISGAQFATILDSSGTNSSITRSGEVNPSSFTPFNRMGWSVWFNAAADSITAPIGAGQAFGTGDFTVEAFLFTTTTAANLLTPSSGASSWSFLTSGNQLYWQENGANLLNAGTVPLGQWTHVAVSRSSGAINGYVNGTRVFTASNSFNYTGTPTRFIGSNGGNAGFFMSNIRVVKGTGLYSGATITVPTTTLTAVAGTALLACTDRNYWDYSTTPRTLMTVNGGAPMIQPFSPFNFNVGNNIVAVGGSGYFDGSSDWLTRPNIAFGANPFTIEGWFYNASTTNNSHYWGQSNGTGANPRCTFYMDGTNLIFDTGSVSGTVLSTAATNIRRNAWHHIVVCRSGTGAGQTALFIDGNRVTTGTSGNLSAITGTFSLGYTGDASAGISWNGNIASFRVVAGTDVYGAGNTTITVPTEPLPPVANTQLLLLFNNAVFNDSACKQAFIPVGTAQISGARSLTGGTSIFIPTAGNYVAPRSPLISTNGPFTWECWFWSLDTSKAQALWCTTGTGYGGGVRGFGIIPGQGFSYYGNTTGFTATGGYVTNQTPAANQWVHYAVSRDASNVWRFFINGVFFANTRVQMTWNGNNFGPSLDEAIALTGQNIGLTVSGTGETTGYIEDMRITAACRYSTDANFTPPPSPPPIVS